MCNNGRCGDCCIGRLWRHFGCVGLGCSGSEACSCFSESETEETVDGAVAALYINPLNQFNSTLRAEATNFYIVQSLFTMGIFFSFLFSRMFETKQLRLLMGKSISNEFILFILPLFPFNCYLYLKIREVVQLLMVMTCL